MRELEAEAFHQFVMGLREVNESMADVLTEELFRHDNGDSSSADNNDNASMLNLVVAAISCVTNRQP